MSYINKDCIYKIESKISPGRVIKLNTSKMKPILYNKMNSGRNSTDDDDQNWYFDYYEKFDSYKIVNEKTKKILRYDEDDSQDIIMEDLDTHSIYCHWKFEMMNDGYVMIRNAGDTKRVLDIFGSDKRNGTNLILYKETGNSNQRFKLIRHKFKKDYKYKPAEKLEKRHIQEENTYRNLEDLKDKIFKSERFIKKWANIADMLGYKFCIGTRGIDIGEDFSIKKENGKYIIKANYRKRDPFAYEGTLKDRLEIQVSDIKLTFDPSSIKAGKPTISDLTPTVISTTNAVNYGNSDATIGTEIEYTVGQTISNSTSNSISNSIGVENSFKVKVHGLKFEQSFTYNITHEKSWGYQEDKSTESKVKSTYSTTVPPGGNVPIYALLYQSKATIPYKAVATISYAIRFSGYLKRDNALRNKLNQHELTYYSFGTRDIPATKFLEKEYLQRDVKDSTSAWDYTWSILNYEPDYFNKRMSEALTPEGVEISGIFTNLSSTNVSIVSGKKPNEEGSKILGEEKVNIKEKDDPNIKTKIDVTIDVED